MFRKNEAHLNPPDVSSINALPDKQRQRLETTWAKIFYQEFFCRLDEERFAVLYTDKPSRPNIPVNVLVGLEAIKAGFGWNDEELYDAFCFNLQVRYALGYHQLDEGHFELRTLYYFRARLTEHMQATGENLIEQAFEQITDEQVIALELKSGKLRMDSTQIASNIRQMSRLQLLVEVVQRLARCLNELDQVRYEELLAPYLKGSSGQYVYPVKSGEGNTHLEAMGQVMHQLVVELGAFYTEEQAYQQLVRVFEEHFVLSQGKMRIKEDPELSASSLQSPDDEEATYRYKSGQGYQGYVANVAETCDPDNELQLIVKMQVEANTTDDGQMLAEALPDLKARTEVSELYTDGGYPGTASDQALAEQQVELIPSAIRGRQPDPDRLDLADFVWELDAEGHPQTATCPQGQHAEVKPARQQERYTALFNKDVCEGCPLRDLCPTKPLKRKRGRVLRFKQRQVRRARQRQHQAQAREGDHNLRSAVEATMRSVKHPFGNGKLPVRGRARVNMMMIASAAMTNVRRIWRYQVTKIQDNALQIAANDTPQIVIAASFVRSIRQFVRLLTPAWQGQAA